MDLEFLTIALLTELDRVNSLLEILLRFRRVSCSSGGRRRKYHKSLLSDVYKYYYFHCVFLKCFFSIMLIYQFLFCLKVSLFCHYLQFCILSSTLLTTNIYTNILYNSILIHDIMCKRVCSGHEI